MNGDEIMDILDDVQDVHEAVEKLREEFGRQNIKVVVLHQKQEPPNVTVEPKIIVEKPDKPKGAKIISTTLSDGRREHNITFLY